MMRSADVYLELFGRVRGEVEAAVRGLDAEQLRWRPAPDANSIGWLVWHLTRVQDHHVSELDGQPQTWVTGDWAQGFGLEPDADDTGYGHDSEQVALVQPTRPEAVLRYYDAVAARTEVLLQGLTDTDLDRVVDRRWDPPVTLGVRLVSIADDDIQHAGQALYVRGMLPA